MGGGSWLGRQRRWRKDDARLAPTAEACGYLTGIRLLLTRLAHTELRWLLTPFLIAAPQDMADSIREQEYRIDLTSIGKNGLSRTRIMNEYSERIARDGEKAASHRQGGWATSEADNFTGESRQTR
jgi:hypothetical protein